jgi:D-lactate dehydrogenase
MLTDSYRLLYDRLLATFPRRRLISDQARTLALGTDASFYRLTPHLVVQVESETEVIALLREARALRIPVTFRAAGTSLSGQSVTDSVLMTLGPTWNHYTIPEDAGTISLQPGVIGAHANLYLAPHGKKIGPDPASINAAMVGGIAANNASGMCCGTAQNSYNTLASMRVILADGTHLDSASQECKESFQQTHAGLLHELGALARRVRENAPLADRIRRKFKMKNTTGYSINALVDFEDPIDILTHLMIGSEGTLGFIASITYRTVPELADKASSLMLFPDIATACQAVEILKRCSVDAVELMDRASLRSVEDKPGMPPYLRSLAPGVAGLLVETRAPSPDALQQNIDRIHDACSSLPVEQPITFTTIAAEYAQLWDIRKGLFPSVGAMRETGTTVIIEDVAFPVPRLAGATLDLQSLFRKHGYHEAIIFGHALEGNLHFVFKQDFNTQAEIQRYAAFIDDVTDMVVRTYDGSLKAEHGTGRNMAPFVELEWGAQAYAIMMEIKQIFDPENLLNPGVILSADPRTHLKNLKPMPAADPLVDKCIECGFCEVQCPSRNLTFTPRQRIVVYREISRLRATGEDPPRRAELERSFHYLGEQTCATDGLCATTCPVTIDTGKLIKQLREKLHSPLAQAVARIVAGNMSVVTWAMRLALNLIDRVHGILRTPAMSRASRWARRLSRNRLPMWNPAMPKGADRVPRRVAHEPGRPSVVYFPTCINRTLGVPHAERGQDSLTLVILRLLDRAGYNVVLPDHLSSLCCGMAFASKGFRAEGDRKAQELKSALLRASNGGALPVLVDMSPCLLRMKECFGGELKLHEPVAFILKYIVGNVTLTRKAARVAVHTTCSAEKMGLAADLKRLALMCAEGVVVPQGVGCCGWAGDRGFTVPELNAAALASLRGELGADCSEGYSTSRTCEIGLTLHGGIPYRSIVNLVEECAVARPAGAGSGDGTPPS